MDRYTQEVVLPDADVTLFVRRDDLIHPTIPGNKFRKLKYNIKEAKELGYNRLLTFGGAFSNHISAVAAAGKEYGFETIGIIRGEELATQARNPTLAFAEAQGMHLNFVSRAEYKEKESAAFLANLREQYGDYYHLPEGGTNALAVKGCEEIVSVNDHQFDYICCAVGTGGTLAGIINSSAAEQKIIGFPVLQADLSNSIAAFANKSNWTLVSDYCFGGYAKVNAELIRFINDFSKQNAMPLDPVYTGKLFYGVIDLIGKNFFSKGSKILIIHTGGLQGIAGMNNKLSNKNLQTIETND